MVKVKPNKFHFTFRSNNYKRPPKFKLEGSVPLKVPTILMPKPDPYEPVQDININADLSLATDRDKGGKHYAKGTDDQLYAASEHQKQTEPEVKSNDVPFSPQHPQPPPPFSPMMMMGSETSPFHFNPEMMKSGLIPPPPLPPLDPELMSMIPPPPPPPLPPIPPPHGMHPMFQPFLPIPNTDTTNSNELSPDVHKRVKRSLNLREPYHHHVNFKQNQNPPLPLPPPPMIRNPRGYPFVPPHRMMAPPLLTPPPPPIPLGLFPPPMNPTCVHCVRSELTPQEQFIESESMLNPNVVQNPNKNGDHQQKSTPMKINIGEHYDPQMVYMDESLVPNFEDINSPDDTINMAENAPEPQSESYRVNSYQKNNYQTAHDDGPDDFRINFSISGIHGGPMVPKGYGRDIEQYNEQIKNYDIIPIGLDQKQLYNYYLGHTFTQPLKIKQFGYSKMKKPVVFKKIFGWKKPD